MTGSVVTGQFLTVKNLSINSNEHFEVAYNSNNVTLTVASGPQPVAQGALSRPPGNFLSSIFAIRGLISKSTGTET